MERQIRHNRVLMIIMLLVSLISSFFLVNYLVRNVGTTTVLRPEQTTVLKWKTKE